MTAAVRAMVAALALGALVALVTPAPPRPNAVAQAASDEVVDVPPEGEADLQLLRDGTRVWVVHQPGGEVDVFTVGTPGVDPDEGFAPDAAIRGVHAPVQWVASERLFLGGAVVFRADGAARGWTPLQVGGAEDAGPVAVQDLDRYLTEPVDEGRVRVGALQPRTVRDVPADLQGPTSFDADQVRSPVRTDEPGVPPAEALALPPGTVTLVDAAVVVDGTTPPRLCDVPDVPVPDLPPCADDAPEPVGVTARDPDPAAYEVAFGPYLVRVVDGGLGELIGSSASAGRYDGEPPPSRVFDGDPSTLQRLDGAAPADLAVAVSRARFADGRTFRAVLARDDAAADAVSGAVLTRDGPLLFTGRDQLPPQTLEELRRVLAPRDPADGVTAQTPTVQLLGGTAAISAEVEQELVAAGFVPVRLAGPTRVETSIAVAGASRTNGPEGAIPEVLLARADAPSDDPGEAWADAVAGGGWAAASSTPVLLTPRDGLHPAVLQAFADFRTTSTVLLGGTAALSDAVAAAAPAPRRVAGDDRTATAGAIATDLWRYGTSRFVLFDGYAADGWTAALAGAGLSADAGAPLLVAGPGAELPTGSAAAVARSCGWREADAVAVGAADGSGVLDVCPGEAQDGVVLEIEVNSGRDTFHEDADVVATVRNDTGAPLQVDAAAAVADVAGSEDGEELFTPVLAGGGATVDVAPGATVEVLRSSPFPAPPGAEPGSSTAGRYRLAVGTSAGTARADFFIELPGPGAAVSAPGSPAAPG